MLAASGNGDDRHRRRLDQGSRSRAPSRDGRFIGGHPVCGSEAHGAGARERRALPRRDVVPDAGRARPTPSATARCTASSPRSARVPVAVDPNAHDRLVALTSHLPHALANVLLNQAGASRIDGHEPLAAAGGSLRDMTRVAGANPRIWVDIFLDNAEALAGRARRAPPPGRAGRARARRGRRRLPRALDRGGVRQPAAHARRRLRAAGRAAAPARPRARPAGRAGRDHAGARRRADQHRGLRAAAHVARARRHADAARRRRGRGRARRRRCSRRRATTSSSRPSSTNEGSSRPARSSVTSPCPATSRSPTAPC